MEQVPILDQLIKLQKQQVVSFHMPGHKNGAIFEQISYKNFKDILVNIDTTEIPGTDNLHNPKDAIKKAQDRASKVFGSEETYFLVNGSTSGIYSMLMAVTSPGDKVIVNRNCHQSVIHGLLLGDCTPVYVYPEMDIHQGIALAISPRTVEEALIANPDAKAVLITYPTYHGIASDLSLIAEIVHRYDKILLVDEAHGAHFGLSEVLPKSALACGADLVVQSTHKTLPSFTQSSMLHMQGNRIDREKLKFMLRIHQSTSPSYLLLASLDMAVMIYETQGTYLMKNLLENINWFKESISDLKGVKLLDQSYLGYQNIHHLDPTKLWISLEQLSLSGYQVDEILRKEYSIQMELSNLYGTLGITTIGNHKKDFERLSHALRGISQRGGNKKIKALTPYTNRVPKQIYTPREAIYKEKKAIPLQESVGLISGSTIVPYPPGIPMLIPGEEINQEMIQYIQMMISEGMEVLGLRDEKRLLIDVIVDNNYEVMK